MYIPSYLSGSVERNDRGWPIGVEVDEQAALVLLVTEALEAHGGTAELPEIHRYTRRDLVKAKYKERCPRFYNSVVWDYSYACLDRALRASIAYACWTLGNCE
jgi:hypothetical protein